MRGGRDSGGEAGPEEPDRTTSEPLQLLKAEGSLERTGRERERNLRLERAEDLRSVKRLSRPTVPEQQLISVLATLGERYGTDYVREHKVKDGAWYVAHVDFAWPEERLVIEVYGGPHYKPALDRLGTREADDAARIAQIEEAGWSVLIVRDTELAQVRWVLALEQVRTFLKKSRN